VQYWIKRASGKRLDRVDFSTHSSRPQRMPRQTAPELEQQILLLRQQLSESILGESGADAIREALLQQHWSGVPSTRTINRILQRHGLFDRRRRRRWPSPRPGWYLPEVAAGIAELDSADLVEGLLLEGGIDIEVLNIISLHGGLVNSWPQQGSFRAKQVVSCLLEHWQEVGLPGYAQFDNGTCFQGPHQHPDVISRVMRLCLSLGVTVVFATPREHGFQNSVESYNGRWQAKLWSRYHHASVAALTKASGAYVAAVRQRSAARIEAAPERRAFPADWRLNFQQHPQGRLIYLRRTSDTGWVELLGHRFFVESQWGHRLVRCQVDLNAEKISIFGLRRRQPEQQPLLTEHVYRLPKRPFHE
jgi:hypothetical protein